MSILAFAREQNNDNHYGMAQELIHIHIYLMRGSSKLIAIKVPALRVGVLIVNGYSAGDVE